MSIFREQAMYALKKYRTTSKAVTTAWKAMSKKKKNDTELEGMHK